MKQFFNPLQRIQVGDRRGTADMRRLKSVFSNSETTANIGQATEEIGEIFPLSPK
jgi:hypothetical protein